MSLLDERIKFNNELKILNSKIIKLKKVFFISTTPLSLKEKTLNQLNELNEQRTKLINRYLKSIGVSQAEYEKFRSSIIPKEFINIPDELILDFLEGEELDEYSITVSQYLENEKLIEELEKMLEQLEAELEVAGGMPTSFEEPTLNFGDDLTSMENEVASMDIPNSKKTELMKKIEALKKQLQEALNQRDMLSQSIAAFQAKNQELQKEYELKMQIEKQMKLNKTKKKTFKKKI